MPSHRDVTILLFYKEERIVITVYGTDLRVVENNNNAFVVEGLRIVFSDSGEGELDIGSLRARYVYTEKPGSRFQLENEGLFHAKMWGAGYSAGEFTPARKEVERLSEELLEHFLTDRGFLPKDE